MDNVDDDLYLAPETLSADLLRFAQLRMAMEASMAPVEDPELVWIVQTTVHLATGDTVDFTDKLDLALSEYDNRVQSDPKHIALGQVEQTLARGEFLLDFYKNNKSSVSRKITQAAFSNYELARKLSGYLYGADLPAQVSVSDVTVEVDQFKHQLLDGKRPYTVLMMGGHIFEVWGEGSPDENMVETIDEVSYNGKNFSGTFWAWDMFYAFHEAKMSWSKLQVGSPSK